MKKMLAALMLVAFAATLAIASDVVTYPAKNGAVTFDHKAHQGRNECKACHEGTPAKIAIDKDKAHALCKDCHAAKNADMAKCNYCHKK